MVKKLSNALYLLKYAWCKCKPLFFTASIKYLLAAILPLYGVVGLGSVVDALVSGKSAKEVRGVIMVYLAVTLAVTLAKTAVTFLDNRVMRKASDVTQLDYMKDCVYIDYHHVQDGSILDLKKKSMTANPVWFIDDLFKLTRYITEFVGVAYLFITLSPWFILLVSLTSAVSVCLNFKKQKSDYDYTTAKAPHDRKTEYLFRVMSDYKYAKDIRVGRASGFISEKYRSTLGTMLADMRVLSRKNLAIDAMCCIMTVLQSVLMYGYFSYRLSAGMISVAEYTVLIGATTLLLSVLFDFFFYLGRLDKTLKYTDLFREYRKKVADNSIIALTSDGASPDTDPKTACIEFSHVSFCYPNTDRMILRDISFILQPGEKLAVVGLNGSGKTTLIKLLCRLYDPTEGVITYGGVDIKTIPYGEYTHILGVVLQDFCLFAYSVKENIVFDGVTDEIKLKRVFEQAGLADKIDGLPRGVDTSVYKSLDDGGVEFSGGEGQKLALARAIYKDADIMVLDEPTSSLDPLAEYELFSRLSEISDGKTTLFISHRLSSTRFCDRIFVLHDGCIAEAGSHTELMNAHGIYAEMFAAQAKYYERTDGVQ